MWIVVLLIVFVVLGDRVMAKIKDGVEFGPELKPSTQRMISAAEYAFGQYGIRPTITEAWAQAGHIVGSKHYSGDALDFRIWESQAIGVTARVAQLMQSYLGRDYDVVVESDHIHVEYDPK